MFVKTLTEARRLVRAFKLEFSDHRHRLGWLVFCLKICVRRDLQGAASCDLRRPQQRKPGPAAAGWVPLGHPIPRGAGHLLPGELARCLKVPFLARNTFFFSCLPSCFWPLMFWLLFRAGK